MFNENEASVEGVKEEEEKVVAAKDRINQWKSEYPAIANLGQAELSLLKQLIAAPEQYKEEQFLLICDFLDRDDAYDHIAAYYEAKCLGMDTSFNVAFMFACAASNNGKGNKTNRVAQLLDSMNHFRYTANTKGDKHSGNEKSPLG